MMRLLPVAIFFMIVFAPPKAVLAEEIHDAARAGDLAKVQALIEKAPDLTGAIDKLGRTPLHHAAEMGRRDVVAYLIERGAGIDQRDSLERTPLLWCAAGSASREVAGFLLAKGADIDARDNINRTPLLASRSGEFMDFLLKNGAVLPARTDPTIPDLMAAALRRGSAELMNRLMAGGANYRSKDEAGNNALHLAAAGGSVEIIGLLLDAGLSIADANGIGWTPLHSAAESGQLKAVEILLAKGAPLDARTKDGKSAFNLAQEWGKEDIADFLAARGADRSDVKFPVLSGAYFGQKTPGKIPELFAPGIVSAKHAFHGSVSFSSDGRSAYWPLWNYGGRTACLESMLSQGRWTLPKPVAFAASGWGDDVPFPSPDGHKLYFLSRRPLGKDGPGGKENIWVREKTGAGWSEPRPLSPIINAMGLHWQVSVDRRGNLYFSGNGKGPGYGALDIYWSRFENGAYSPPENLGPVINGPGFNHSPFIAPDGSYLIYSRCDLQDREGTLLISFRRRDETWSPPRDLHDRLGNRTRSICPWVTPDGRYLFFIADCAGESKPFWVDAGFIEDLRKTEFSTAAAVAEDFKRVEKRKGD
jgi:ankyrin repeat protein